MNKNTEYCKNWRDKHKDKYNRYQRDYKREHKIVLSSIQKFIKKLFRF